MGVTFMAEPNIIGRASSYIKTAGPLGRAGAPEGELNGLGKAAKYVATVGPLGRVGAKSGEELNSLGKFMLNGGIAGNLNVTA